MSTTQDKWFSVQVDRRTQVVHQVVDIARIQSCEPSHPGQRGETWVVMRDGTKYRLTSDLQTVMTFLGIMPVELGREVVNR